MSPRALAIAFVFLAACKKTSTSPERDAGRATFVPAPDSSLARALGADDAGKGVYRWFDDGPWCGQAPRIDRKKPLGATVTRHASEIMDPVGTAEMGFFETDRPPNMPPEERGALDLALSGPKRVVAGEVVKLALSLSNAGPGTLRYAIAVDGSFEHWRSPFVDLHVRDEASKRVYRWSHGAAFGRCGNVNPRTNEDYVLLAPGQRRQDPFGSWSHDALSFVLERPGVYTLWVVYASCSGAERAGGSDDVPKPDDLFEGTIVSNALPIDVAVR
jgi:hypothetical protein